MRYEDTHESLQRLVIALKEFFPEIRFCPLLAPKVLIGNWSEERGVLVRGDGIGNQSGVYFITTEEGDILYIGKATKGNLHERVWDHIQTPEICPSGRRIFPKNKFEGKGLDESAVSLVREGKVKIGVISVTPASVVSLAEVFLHTVYEQRHNALPLLNMQIG